MNSVFFVDVVFLCVQQILLKSMNKTSIIFFSFNFYLWIQWALKNGAGIGPYNKEMSQSY